MGNYATTAQLQARFEDTEAVCHLTDSEDTGTPDSAVLDEVLDGAEGLIDSYLSRRYLVPVAVTDTVQANFMNSLTLDVAQYHLLLRGDVMPEAKVKAYDDRVEWLRAVVAGKAGLPGAATPTTTGSREPVAAWGTGAADTSERNFTRESQEGL